MKNIMKILAKEIRRIRILIIVMENFSNEVPFWKMELETLKRTLGLMIKKELDKSRGRDYINR